jgi:GDSL-like Lipase/Acylhydrolase family
MTEAAREFMYSNLSGREPGRFLQLASRLLPGIGRVQAQVEPYAQAWRESNLRALDGEGPLWVALGDSLTQGIGASAYDRGWVGQLRSRLAEGGRSFRVVNLSVSGSRVDDVLETQMPAFEAMAGAPDLVTLLIGSNDLFRRGARGSVADRYEHLLRRLPVGTVVGTLPNPSPTARALNQTTLRVAAERDFVVADTRRDPRTQFWTGKLAADRFHPNDHGYTAVTGVFGDAITRSGGGWT